MARPPAPSLKQLHAALLGAFPTQRELERMVRFGLHENLATLAVGDSLADIAFKLLEWAEAQGRLTELVAAALEANPTNPQLRVCAAGLGLGVPSPDEPAEAPPPPCPYPGMISFRIEDARFFHGREAEIRRMVLHLRQHHFLLVVGPSGSGKSSLVFAGLLAQLPSSPYWSSGFWHTVTLRPGAAPTDMLVARLGGDLTRPAPLIDTVLAAHPPARCLLLVIDQFEEIFTQTTRNEQSRFISALTALRTLDTCAVILIMRADFFHDLMNSVMWPIGPGQRLEVAPLRGEALREAIQRPAAPVGVMIEDGLVERLLAEAADEPGSLPLLQETLVLLWGQMVDRTLTLEAYERLGQLGQSGLGVALASKAEATLAGLTPAQQTIARRIFLRLIHFGRGQQPDTRRQQPRTALQSPDDDARLFQATLDTLADNRLLTLDRREPDGEGVVDIAHEVLLVCWPTLQQWVEERREAGQSRQRLEQKTAEWVRLGQGHGGLLDDAELPEAARWLSSLDAAELGTPPDLPDLVKASRAAIQAARDQKLLLERRARYAMQGLALLASGLALVLVFNFIVFPQIRRWQAAGELVAIPAGTAVIGIPPPPTPCEDCANEQPQWTVEFPTSFSIERYEVANRQYRLCLDDQACSEPQTQTALDWFNDPALADHPVVGVTARQAFIYCRWLGRRLPTELEWERAARGPLGRPWPWGDTEPDATRVHLHRGMLTLTSTVPITSHPAGSTPPPEAVFNLVGNVQEWTASYPSLSYDFAKREYVLPGVWDDGTLATLAREGSLIVRGGSYQNGLDRITQRRPLSWYRALDDLGFRCAAGGAPPRRAAP